MERQERPETERDAALVAAVRAGRKDAFAELVEAWFDPCWEVSWRILRDRERAAEVTQDVMLAAWQKLDTLSDPGAFGGWVLRMSRNRSLDRLAHERRMQPTDDDWMLEPRDPTESLGDPEREAVRSEAHDMVWDAAAVLGERDASILDLHLRHGLEARELAVELGIEPNAANQALHRMRGRLGIAIQARLLWRRGRPGCELLADELARSRVTVFDARLVRLIDRHAKTCAECTRRQKQAAGAIAAFAAVPFVAASPALRTSSADVLAAQGVPVPTSWTTGGASAATPAADHAAEPADAAAGPAPDAAATEVFDGPPGVAASGPGSTAPDQPGLAERTRRDRSGAIVLGIVSVLLVLGATGVVAGVLRAPSPVEAPTPTQTPTPITSSSTPSPSATPLPTPSAPPPPTVGPPPTPVEPSPETEVPVTPAPTVRVSAVWVGIGRCPDETPFLYRITWSTSDASTARLAGTWGDDEVALSGAAERCAARTAQFTLTATGPGGSRVETVEAEATPST